MTAHIVATCQQTRFHLVDDKRSPEVHIHKLNVSIVSSGGGGDAPKATRLKQKATTDILTDADLKLKGGKHYGLLGRNGTGKSTLLRAISSKLIPGLSLATKVAILQQNALDDARQETSPSLESDLRDKTPLQYILASDTSRNNIEAELGMLRSAPSSTGTESAQIREYRKLRHLRLQKQLAEVQKNATLRSGARGWQARKELNAFEKHVEEAKQAISRCDLPFAPSGISEELAKASELESELQLQLDELSLVDRENEASHTLKALGFTGDLLATPFRKLSGGWQMRCALASVLIQDADIMILDEPTNFLDLLGIVWLQIHLTKLQTIASPKTVVLVSHDRDFINNVCNEIIVLKDQELSYFEGNLTAYEEDLQDRRLYMTTMKEAHEKQKAQKEKSIVQAVKSGKKSGDDNKLRHAASRQRKLEERSGMQVNAKGHRFKLNRDLAGYHYGVRAEIEIPPDEASNRLALPMAPDLRTVGSLLSLEAVSLTFRRSDARIPVLKNINMTVHMGDRIGIMGLNGSGKTTLIKILTGRLKVSSGIITTHPNLKTGYYSQLAVEELRSQGRSDATMTALRVLQSKAGDAMEESDIRGLLGSFGLPGRLASHVPVSKLSGGQLVRLALACIVWNHPHLLVLDEISTHLDFYTVKALAKALLNFNGTVILVSHDRFLMKSLVDGDVTLLGEEEHGSDSETKADELRRKLFLLESGSMSRLRDVGEFEKGLEKRVVKLVG